MLVTYTEAMGLMVAVDIATVILKMRAPGMSLRTMPLFVWASLVTSVMIIFAMPMVMLAANLVQFDRMLGTHFFNPAEGGDPLLWQHLFWFFGHPEVYFISFRHWASSRRSFRRSRGGQCSATTRSCYR
jgi:cytochrome c oxidase subunit 1